MTSQQIEVFFGALSLRDKILFYLSQAYTLTILAGLLGETPCGFPDCLMGEYSERALETWRLHVDELMDICQERQADIHLICRTLTPELFPATADN